MKILKPLTWLLGFPVSDVHECPHCGSQEIRLSRMPQSRLFKLLGFARYRCENCDASYVRWQRLPLVGTRKDC
jgi:transposase-like protein